MIPISVCIIARNEEKNIEKCLLPLKKYPVEIIIADTGSTDRTKEIASRYADKLLDFSWINDFSAARNFSIANASNDWVLVLDCDEFLEEFDWDQTQTLIHSYPDSVGQLSRINLCHTRNGADTILTDPVERLFNRKNYYYTGTIHEQLTSKSSQPMTAFQFPMTLTHIGYLGTPEEIEAKAKRNIDLLVLELKNHPKDPYLYYQLGESYSLKNDYETAYQYYDRGFGLEVDEKLDYVQIMIVSYGYSMLYTGRIEKALTLAGVYDAFCENADFVFMMGNIYLKARENAKALLEFIKATTLSKHFQEGTNSFRAFHNIGCIYEAYGDINMAKTFFEKAENFPLSVERLRNLQENKI